MADKRIQDLPSASSVQLNDLLVLEQSGAAMSVSGNVLVRDLATALDGHGGISNITYTAPTGSSLVGSLTITLADGTATTFYVTNGKGITEVTSSKVGDTTTYVMSFNDGTNYTFTVTDGTDIASITSAKSGLTTTVTVTMSDGSAFNFTVNDGVGIEDITWASSGTPGDGMTHTGTILYTDGSTSTVTIQDGNKGDTGAQTYVWIKWSDGYPQSDADMTNTPSSFIGICTGTMPSAPTAYTEYSWYQWKGDEGDPGATGDYIEPVASYGTSTAAGSLPSTWYNSPTSLSYSAGNFIWKRIEYTLHEAQTVQATTTEVIGYIGQNGTGSGTVTQITFNNEVFQDDGTGNVGMTVDAADVGAIADPSTKSNGQVLTYDSTAGEWVAQTPQTGNVNTVNNIGVTAGTTNIALTGDNIPLSANDSTPVSSAVPAPATTVPADLGTAAIGSASAYAKADHVHKMPSASDVGAVSTADVQFKIYDSIADLPGFSSSDIGSVTIAGAYSAMPNKSILITNAGDFSSNEVPMVYGVVVMVKLSAPRGFILFRTRNTSTSTTDTADYRMFTDSSGVPTGVWVPNGGVIYINFSVALSANSNVSPFSYYGTLNIASHVPAGCVPVSAVGVGGSTGVILVNVSANGNNLYVYGHAAGNVTVRVGFGIINGTVS